MAFTLPYQTTAMSDTIERIYRSLEQITADYHARKILGEIAVRFHALQHDREMFMLLESCPYWIDRDQFVIECSNRISTFAIRQLYRTIAAVADQWEIKDVFLTWRNATQKPFHILASMGAGDSIFDLPPPLDLDASITEAMRIGDIVRSSENPIGVVVLDSDWQIWCNQALSALCGKPLEVLVRTNVRANWVDRRAKTDDGLATIKKRLRREVDFVQSYCTKLAPEASVKHNFESRFRLMLDGRVRLTEIYSCEPVI